MIKLVFIITLTFFSIISVAQTSFSGCRDTLYNKIRRDTMGLNASTTFTDWQDCVKGKQMPYLSFKAIDGKKIKTEELLGKVVVFNLWFTTCRPCIAEMPVLNKVVADFKNKNVIFLGLCLDSKEILEKQFFPKYKFDFTIIPDAGPLVDKLVQTGYPTTYIIDRKGKITAAWCLAIAKDENTVYQRLKQVIESSLTAQ